MNSYDVIIVGSGFASGFFLHEFLRRSGPKARVLVLERGSRNDHSWQIEHRRNSPVDEHKTIVSSGPANKSWRFNIGFGGGSSCWWASTPRMMPNDFRVRTIYGVGQDWPIAYGDLEDFYQQAETLMQIAGATGKTPFPRKQPYPLPPHRLATPDRLLQERFPGLFVPQPTGRASISTDKRPQCCANGVCNLCPVNAKFTIAQDFADLFEDPRVTLRLDAEALHVETLAGTATGVTYRAQGRPETVQADIVVLAANGFFNPYILQKSGIADNKTGKGVTEQLSINAIARLDGIESFDGSTSITGHGYMLYDGPHRARNAGCLIETYNVPFLRPEAGRWRETLLFKLIFEDIPDARNYVIPTDTPGKPRVHFEAHSDYTVRGIEWARQELPRILKGLPIESLEFADRTNATEAHMICGTPMGNSPANSVVDADLVHHRYRNLLVLGSGVFPSCPPANPTLTISALALRAASRLLQSQQRGAA